ncbi:hypothetical protein CC80DRAFT_488489 [Byssothecium circinans]|uniref:Uncharacterized protein n=1 Tax=Byssothecium circinans TaxID=147558 RepID=A0A6A5UBG3_9PLEO|nr:hypothetical protein CC80DRAFT_488489 [Byssothecium circinans]
MDVPTKQHGPQKPSTGTDSPTRLQPLSNNAMPNPTSCELSTPPFLPNVKRQNANPLHTLYFRQRSASGTSTFDKAQPPQHLHSTKPSHIRQSRAHMRPTREPCGSYCRILRRLKHMTWRDSSDGRRVRPLPAPGPRCLAA